MEIYFGIKLLHIISATLLFGTGVGTAFFMLRAYSGESSEAFVRTTETVVLADSLFTAPAVVIQLVTGLWLTSRLGIPYDSLWFFIIISLFMGVGICWLPVVWIQIRVRNLARNGKTRGELRGLMRTWIILGVPAFMSVLILFTLMVYKPWTSILIFGRQSG